jgi:tetratricopeptide (TPR) repeat protein
VVGGLALAVLCAVVAGGLARNRVSDHGTTTIAAAASAFAEGERLYRGGLYRDSVEPLERATRSDPEFAPAWAALAKSYSRASQPGNLGTVTGSPASRSHEAAVQALRLAPQAAASHLAAALAFRAARDVPHWRAEANRAIELDRRLAEAYAVLADSFNGLIQYSCERDQNPELADRYYAQALALDPSFPPDSRATNLRYLGRYAECIDLVTDALARSPAPPVQQEARGRCRLMQGDLAGAAADIEPLRHNRRTGTANSLMDLGWLQLQQGNTVDGIESLEQAANTATSALNELTVAYVYGHAGDSHRAVTHMQRAFALDSACPRMVATGIAFEHLRTFPEVQHLLSQTSGSGGQAATSHR